MVNVFLGVTSKRESQKTGGSNETQEEEGLLSVLRSSVSDRRCCFRGEGLFFVYCLYVLHLFIVYMCLLGQLLVKIGVQNYLNYFIERERQLEKRGEDR